MASNRINVVLNGRQNLKNVLKNLDKLVMSDDRMLLMTTSEPSITKALFSETFGWDNETINQKIYFFNFTKKGYSDIDVSVSDANKSQIFCMKMPNSLYHTIPTALNDALNFIDETKIARFAHFFMDDCKIVSDSYNPSTYEKYMEDFNEQFIMDSKTNDGNFAFKKYSPRFIFMSRNYIPQPISFVQFESKEHFIIDRDNMKLFFDEKIKRLYMTELIYRLHKEGMVKHLTFYPDPVLEQYVERAKDLPHITKNHDIEMEYINDNNYLKNELKIVITVENSVNPIIKEMSDVIKNMTDKNKMNIKEVG